MDYLEPVSGTIISLDPARLSFIVSFSLKALLFCVPFLAVGFLFERDVYHVGAFGKVVKVLCLTVFVVPVLLFAVFNLTAPVWPVSFWENNQILQSLWIMEGVYAPIILGSVCILYLFLYSAEILRGDLRD